MEDDFASALNAAQGIAVPRKVLYDPASPAVINVGPKQDRIELKAKKNEAHGANHLTAEEIIGNIEMAKDLMTDTRNAIQNQTTTALHAQANLIPRGVLDLLK